MKEYLNPPVQVAQVCISCAVIITGVAGLTGIGGCCGVHIDVLGQQVGEDGAGLTGLDVEEEFRVLLGRVHLL